MPRADELPTKVTFDGPGQVKLVGYLFRPTTGGSRAPAIVLMHGRAGPYSTQADGVYEAATLSKRHRMWGRLWADESYVGFLVDGFGPRGYSQGFPVGSYNNRPEAVNEVTERPLDAYAALAYLRTRLDVDPARIALMGWSNGGSAALATMAGPTFAATGLESGRGFRGAIALYPACGLKGRIDEGYRPYAPVRVFSGDADEEVSAKRCQRLVDASRVAGGDIEIKLYPGATHDFDDPGRRRRGVDANVAAADDVIKRARAFMRMVLGR